MEMDVFAFAETIKTKEDFEDFLLLLAEDFKQNGNDVDKWENTDLLSYFRAMSRWTGSMEGYYKNMNKPFDENAPSWKTFADILLAAVVYE